MGLGIVLSVTLASAWDYVEKRAAEQAAQPTPAAASSATSRKPKLKPLAPALLPAPSAATPSPLPAASGPLPHPTSTPSASARQSSTTDEPLSSSELFARANQARRRGDIEDAISLYERLDRAYPGSIEAGDAKILRGNLLLSQRSPRAALRQFEDYHSGALSLEALWGRAQALRKLQSPEERAILVELVRDYPDSPYTEAARKRLRELAR